LKCKRRRELDLKEQWLFRRRARSQSAKELILSVVYFLVIAVLGFIRPIRGSHLDLKKFRGYGEPAKRRPSGSRRRRGTNRVRVHHTPTLEHFNPLSCVNIYRIPLSHSHCTWVIFPAKISASNGPKRPMPNFLSLKKTL